MLYITHRGLATKKMYISHKRENFFSFSGTKLSGRPISGVRWKVSVRAGYAQLAIDTVGVTEWTILERFP